MLNYKDFHKSNAIDTCAVWNILSSKKLTHVSISCGLDGCLTKCVYYECTKKWNKSSEIENELKMRLESVIKDRAFKKFDISVDDLLDESICELSNRIGLGELSALAFARRYRIAFLTDDQKARQLAAQVINIDFVQTTPHLLGWLCYNNKLSDSDKADVVGEHVELGGILEKYFDSAYLQAMSLRLQEVTNREDSDRL